MGKILVFCIALIVIISMAYSFFQDPIKEIKKDISDPNRAPDTIDDVLGAAQVRNLQRAREVGQMANFRTIQTAIVQYYTERGTMPTGLEDLVHAHYLGSDALYDPWRQKLRSEVVNNVLILTSPGQDRIKNTKDDLHVEVPLQ